MPRKKKTTGKPYEGHDATTYRPRVRQAIHAPLNVETGDGERDGDIWLSRIAKTLRTRDEMPNGGSDWRRYWDWFEGEQWMERGMEGRQLATDNARNTATVNITGSIALAYIPFLVNGQIKFKLKPRKPGDATSAEIQQSLLNYEWQERGMTRQIKDIVQDVVVIGHGVGKSGYVVEVDETRRKADGEINYKDYIRKDASYIERVDPLNFLFDLTAKDGTLKTARWCAERFFAPYDDVMANAAYSRDALAQIHTGAYTVTLRTGIAGSENDPVWAKTLSADVPEEKLVTLWEVWDKKFRKRYIFAEGVPKPLVEEAWPYDYLDGFPYTKIDYIKLRRCPYGMGVMRQAEDQQMQLNRIRTSQFLHIRSHNRKFIAVTGAVAPEHLQDFAELPDGAVIQAERPDAIQPIPDAPMSQDFQVVEGRIASDVQQLTGADALLQGAPLPSRTTAGEVSTRANILRLKADDRVSSVEEGVTELARQVLQHLKAHRTIPDVVEIVGAQGNYWQEYASDDIQADTDVSVEYFAAPKFDPGLDRQQRLQVLQLGVQAMPALQQAGAGEQLDVAALFGWVLESFEQKDAGRFFKPALTPQPPLVETAPTAGEGLPPALAGQLAPASLPAEPGAPDPGEGLSVEDLLMQLRGQGVGGTGALPQA